MQVAVGSRGWVWVNSLKACRWLGIPFVESFAESVQWAWVAAMEMEAWCYQGSESESWGDGDLILGDKLGWKRRCCCSRMTDSLVL